MSTYDYMADFRHMPDDGWLSDPDFSLGLVKGLFKVANKSMGSLYGDATLHLNEDDLLDLDDLSDFPGDYTGVIVYASIWAAAAIIFTIVGIVWCTCLNKCKCCCSGRLRDKGDDELRNADPHYELRPQYSQGRKKARRPSMFAIVAALFMAFLLVCLFLMIIQSFGANQKTNEGIDQVEPDLNDALLDIIKYIDVSIYQLDYVLGESNGKFNQRVNTILTNCQTDGGNVADCANLGTVVRSVLGDTSNGLEADSRALMQALMDVRQEAQSARNELDEDYESIIHDVNTGLYWLFMLFNILYLGVFVLVLFGVFLAAIAPQPNLKNTGFILTRVAIVFIFILGILLVAQMLALFFAGGILSEAICPAIREIEDKTPDTQVETHQPGRLLQDGGGYEVPSFGKILRDCKAEKSAYITFDMQDAVDLSSFTEVNQRFRDAIDHLSHLPAAQLIPPEVSTYTNFITTALTNDVGKCGPAYNAMNATISTFCYKIAAPVVGYWWILQFIASTFLLIVVTAFLFERLY